MDFRFLTHDETIIIKAENIKAAADKMVAIAAKNGYSYPLFQIDYEVEFDGHYIDLYSVLPVHPLVELYVS